MPTPEPQVGYPTRLIWHIYSRHPELTGSSDDFLRPLGRISFSNVTNQDHRSFIMENLMLRTEWSRSEAEPHFLSRLVQYADARLSRHPRSDWGIPDAAKTGRTNAQIAVLAWTNVAGISMPSRSIFVQYAPHTNVFDKPLVVQWHETVTLTNAVPQTAITNFVPKITTRTRVIDTRAATDLTRATVYIATTAKIIDDPVEAYAEMERQRSENARARVERKAREAESANSAPETVPENRD